MPLFCNYCDDPTCLLDCEASKAAYEDGTLDDGDDYLQLKVEAEQNERESYAKYLSTKS